MCTCRHLDRNGDGFISVDEVAVLMEELGVEPGPTPPKQAASAQHDSQQQLFGSLADKQQTGVNFSEFLHLNHQVIERGPGTLLH